MRYSYLLLCLLIGVSCKKEVRNPPPPSEQPPVIPTILLKDVEVDHLPSPYYHFEYDASGKAIVASFASGFFNYMVLYENGRISEMRNNAVGNTDRILYTYDNYGRVTRINYADSTGAAFVKLYLDYDNYRLIKLRRDRKIDGLFVTDKTLNMTYYADNNLKDIRYHYLAVKSQPELDYTDHFESYDDKISANSFDLIHNEFFDHLFLLPGVRLQKNNPQKEVLTGDGQNYIATYIYTYNSDNLPVARTGQLTYTNGDSKGRSFDLSETLTYY